MAQRLLQLVPQSLQMTPPIACAKCSSLPLPSLPLFLRVASLPRALLARVARSYSQAAPVGTQLVGCLCNGADAGGHARRTQAQNMGAIEFCRKVAREHPVRGARPSHQEAYAAAVHTIRSISEISERGPQIW